MGAGSGGPILKLCRAKHFAVSIYRLPPGNTKLRTDPPSLTALPVMLGLPAVSQLSALSII